MKNTFKPISPEQYFKNPGYLKLDLMMRGVRVDPSLIAEGLILPKYQLAPGVFGNINLVLPNDTYVSVPYQEPEITETPYRLRYLKGKTYLTSAEDLVRVKLIPHPQFYSESLNQAIKVGDVVACHGSYVSLALGGHRYLQSNLFDDPSKSYRQELVLSVDEVITVLERVKKEGPIDVITLSSWASDDEDGGVSQIAPYVKAIKNFFNVLLFVEIHLPRDQHWIDQTYAMGADSVCYHIGDLCHHGSHHKTGTRDTDKEVRLLEYAVSVFPPGSILSHITMGDREFKDVVQDIDMLTKIKVLPLLTLVNREVVRKNNLNTPDFVPLFGYVYNAAKREKIKMNWFSKLAPFIAPIEGHYFSGDSPRFKLALLNFYQSRFLGGSISAGLSNLRRRLRVREMKTKR